MAEAVAMTREPTSGARGKLRRIGRWYVSFIADGETFDNTDINIERPPTSMRDIKSIERLISHRRGQRVVVIDYSHLGAQPGLPPPEEDADGSDQETRCWFVSFAAGGGYGNAGIDLVGAPASIADIRLIEQRLAVNAGMAVVLLRCRPLGEPLAGT